MSAVTADYDECTCIGGRCMRKEQSYASAFFTFWLVTVKVLNSYLIFLNCQRMSGLSLWQ